LRSYRVGFPTTLIEIAVYIKHRIKRHQDGSVNNVTDSKLNQFIIMKMSNLISEGKIKICQSKKDVFSAGPPGPPGPLELRGEKGAGPRTKRTEGKDRD